MSTAATPYILVRLDLHPAARAEAQRLLKPLQNGATKDLLSEGLVHAVEHATGYRLFLADDGEDVPAPAVAPMKVIRSPFAAAARKASKA
jgi:hypothetical protein